MDNIQKALWLAESMHKNQENGNYFKNHIFPCYELATKTYFPYMFQLAEDVIISVILHDTLEDTKLNSNDIRSHFDSYVSDTVLLVTDDTLLENRKLRKADFYKRVKNTQGYSQYMSIYVKLIDRIQNVSRGGKIDMYREEHEEFRANLYPIAGEIFEDMWEKLHHMMFDTIYVK